MAELETLYELSNCEILRLDVDTDHFYYGGPTGQQKEFYVGVTTVLDVAGPFPEALRMYLRVSGYDEQRERLEVTGARGTKLHDALDRLMRAQELEAKNYPTVYEKDAIATFIQWCKFLNPGKFDTELVVADSDLRIAGTMDFNGFVDEWKLTALMEPLKYLEVDADNTLQLKEAWLEMPFQNKKRIRVVIDWKFTGRSTYSHQLQVAAYKTMNNKSRPGRKATRAFTWRYSPQHKFRFDFKESTFSYKEFMWVYNTFIAYSGKFPQPPTIRRYPETFRLYDAKT